MASGKWVKLEKTTYVDVTGNTRYCTITYLTQIENQTFSLSAALNVSFHTSRTWETVKRTTRQTNTEADGEHVCLVLLCLFSEDYVRWMGCHTVFLQVWESLPFWNGRSTKTVWWWWSSFVLLWDASVWSFLQVRKFFAYSHLTDISLGRSLGETKECYLFQ